MQTGEMERKEGNFPNEVCKVLVLKKSEICEEREERDTVQLEQWSPRKEKCDCLIKFLTVQEANVSAWIRIN